MITVWVWLADEVGKALYTIKVVIVPWQSNVSVYRTLAEI